MQQTIRCFWIFWHSFAHSKTEIAEMLREYELDYHTGMDVDRLAGWIFDYTSGYPFWYLLCS